MSVLLVINAALAIAYSLTCIYPPPFSGFWGFLLAAGFSLIVLFASLSLRASPTRHRVMITRKLLEYLPFVLFAGFIFRRAGQADGTFVLDLISVTLWIASVVLNIVVLRLLSEKRIDVTFPGIDPASTLKRSVAIHALEWGDALLQAACLVLLIQLFFFQLYVIPSESMVPGFMVRDRVVVIKTPSGPKFPLSPIGFPRVRNYDRGNIVVFSNPHYNDTKDARVRSFLSQFVYMLTFTQVQINRDEFGQPKADPLVKRVVGLPGEKLMMVDGVLYSRTADNNEFLPVQSDSHWAAWDIASLPRSELSLVQNIPLNSAYYTLMQSVESIRSNLVLSDVAYEAKMLADRFVALKKNPDTVTIAPDILPRNKREISSLFLANDEITRMFLTTNGGALCFREFMTAWIADTTRGNLYEQRSFQMNLLLKLNFGRLIVRNAELLAAGVTSEVYRNDETRIALLSEADSGYFYMSIHDQRNMFEFPAGNEFIPKNCYLMMGDNRFNSLDMRHSYRSRLIPIDQKDEWSFVYRSNLDPRYVPASSILGTAAFRFWPVSRIGVPE